MGRWLPRHFGRYTLLTCAATGAVWCYRDPAAAAGAWRATLCTGYCTAFAFELYVAKWQLAADDKAAWDRAYASAARHLVRLAERNGGLYIKTGQGLSTANNLLPKTMCDAFGKLHDSVSAKSLDDVLPVLLEDLKISSVTEKFTDFEVAPIAAASIAQVHRAKLDGVEVAVKVQYPEVRRNYHRDMAMIYAICEACRLYDNKLDFGPMMKSIEHFYERELDFEQEAKHAIAFSEGLKREFSTSDVLVPTVKLVTPRILVTEFFSGAVKGNNRAAMKEMGIDVAAVAERIVKVFSYQIMCNGIVHADPHPGNVLVRRHPKTGRAQIAVIDHGLTSTLSDAQRVNWCKLFNATARHDTAGLGELGQKLYGIDKEDAGVLAMVVTLEPYLTWDVFSQVASLSNDTEAMMKYYTENHDRLERVFKLLPPEFMMVVTCNDMVRSLHFDLGAPQSRLCAMAPYSFRQLPTAWERWTVMWTLRLQVAVNHATLVAASFFSHTEKVK